MNWLNSNLVHNILNVVGAVLAAATAILMYSGCTVGVGGALECSASWIPPEIAMIILSVLSVIKIVINLTRDGATGLVKPQPPVADKVSTVSIAANEDTKVKVIRGK